MDNYALIFEIIALVALINIIFYIFKKNKIDNNINTSHQICILNTNQLELKNGNSANIDECCDFQIIDDTGVTVFEAKEIDSFPINAYKINSNNNSINRATHLLADICKGAGSTPSKTIEIVFSPEIQAGFNDGTQILMRTKSGEVLADAINTSTKKISGKGRIVQGGKLRQVAGGAFQLVSIAVAQSHLADIERSLSTIKAGISDILDRMENEDKSKISGALDYLTEISKYIKNYDSPSDISQQKRNAIEFIIKDTHTWKNKLFFDISSVTEKIRNLRDLDTFGTGDTYERLKNLVCEIEPLLKRHKFLLNLSSATSFVTAYLDPVQCEFSRINIDTHQWSQLIENLKSTTTESAKRLLKEAIFNRNSTIKTRFNTIESISRSHHYTAMTQHSNYISHTNYLNQSVNRFFQNNGTVKLAIKFDEYGEIQETAIL